MKKSEELFINMLLKETYKFIPGEESDRSKSGLEEYFHECEKIHQNISGDIVLLNFLEKNCHEVYQIHYNHKTSCYRVNFDRNLLDFPKVWGEFAYLSQSNLENKNLFCELKDEVTGLRDVLLSIEKVEIKTRRYFLISFRSDSYLVSVDKVDLSHFHNWVLKYMGVEENIPFQDTDAA